MQVVLCNGCCMVVVVVEVVVVCGGYFRIGLRSHQCISTLRLTLTLNSNWNPNPANLFSPTNLTVVFCPVPVCWVLVVSGHFRVGLQSQVAQQQQSTPRKPFSHHCNCRRREWRQSSLQRRSAHQSLRTQTWVMVVEEWAARLKIAVPAHSRRPPSRGSSGSPTRTWAKTAFWFLHGHWFSGG